MVISIVLGIWWLVEFQRLNMMSHVVEVNRHWVNFMIRNWSNSDLNKLISVIFWFARCHGLVYRLCFNLEAVDAILLRWFINLCHNDLLKTEGPVSSVHHPLQLFGLVFASRPHGVEVVALEQFFFVDSFLALKIIFFTNFTAFEVLNSANQKLLSRPVAKHWLVGGALRENQESLVHRVKQPCVLHVGGLYSRLHCLRVED